MDEEGDPMRRRKSFPTPSSLQRPFPSTLGNSLSCKMRSE